MIKRFIKWIKSLKAQPAITEIDRGTRPGHHFCNLISSSVVCFEREDGLWIKEYLDENSSEGRTYKVNYCPWCGISIEGKIIR